MPHNLAVTVAAQPLQLDRPAQWLAKSRPAPIGLHGLGLGSSARFCSGPQSLSTLLHHGYQPLTNPNYLALVPQSPFSSTLESLPVVHGACLTGPARKRKTGRERKREKAHLACVNASLIPTYLTHANTRPELKICLDPRCRSTSPLRRHTFDCPLLATLLVSLQRPRFSHGRVAERNSPFSPCLNLDGYPDLPHISLSRTPR